jgi:hypothetical protein
MSKYKVIGQSVSIGSVFGELEEIEFEELSYYIIILALSLDVASCNPHIQKVSLSYIFPLLCYERKHSKYKEKDAILNTCGSLVVNVFLNTCYFTPMHRLPHK